MAYLLDTDTCSFVIHQRRGFEAIVAHMEGLYYGDLLVSMISVAELYVMAAKARNPALKLAQVAELLTDLKREPFDDAAAEMYGHVRASLERAGKIIGPLDTLIAAHALSRGATVVTNNIEEFSRVPGLIVENWYPDPRRGKPR